MWVVCCFVKVLFLLKPRRWILQNVNCKSIRRQQKLSSLRWLGILWHNFTLTGKKKPKTTPEKQKVETPQSDRSFDSRENPGARNNTLSALCRAQRWGTSRDASDWIAGLEAPELDIHYDFTIACVAVGRTVPHKESSGCLTHKQWDMNSAAC